MSVYPPRLIDKAFKLGNYALVALHGSSDNWLTYAALGLIGKTQTAIAGLSEFNTSDARFYKAVAYWMGGEDQQAIQLLKTIETAHAQNLLRLIAKPQISVLAQIPWTRVGSQDWLTAASQNTRFCLNNISFHPEDLPNQPYADIHRFYNPQEPPDFYICQMVEWHLIPPNLQQLPCPIFGQTADYDLHLQAVYPWLKIFDELLVTDQSEWQDVHGLVDVPVSTFPKSFCLPNNFPPLLHQERPFDMFLSGTVTHPYHPDKAKLLHQVLRIPNLKLKIVNGFESADGYYANLASSKVSFTYVRHPSALPTRGIEALAMGCAIAVQKDSVLTLFVGEDDGVLTYEYDLDNLNESLQQIIQNWPIFEARARKGAAIIRQEFSAHTVASQYLRFLTFLAAKPRSPRSDQTTDFLLQKRTILHKGWLPSYDFWQSEILKKIRDENTARLKKRLDQSDEEVSSPAIYIDLTREIVLAEYHRSLTHLTSNSDWLPSVIATYKAGIARFPDSLVLRFNLIRVALHFEQPSGVSDGLELLAETVKIPSSYWKIDPLEDVFPWDFCPTFFNYRQYFDLLILQKTQNKSVNHILCQLILASLYYYWGHYSQDKSHFEKACKFDPDFPHYKLGYARRILRDSPSDPSGKATELIVSLADSTLFLEAFDLLETLSRYHRKSNNLINDILPRVKQFKKQVKSVENFPEATLRKNLDQFQELQNQLPVHVLLEIIVSGWMKLKYVLRYSLNVTEADILPYTCHANTTPEVLLRRIREMESSKFWRLRMLWFRGKWLIRQGLKKVLGRK